MAYFGLIKLLFPNKLFYKDIYCRLNYNVGSQVNWCKMLKKSLIINKLKVIATDLKASWEARFFRWLITCLILKQYTRIYTLTV